MTHAFLAKTPAAAAWALAATLIAGAFGCGADSTGSPSAEEPAPAAEKPPGDDAQAAPDEAADAAPAEPGANMSISTTAFADGQPIPEKYTVEGEDVSPALSWSDLPPGTKQLALIVDDPDAPTPEPWVHWVIYGIPAERKGLPEAVPQTERPDKVPGAVQGKNSWKTENVGYRGPAPPPADDAHRYFFKLYALDMALALKPGLTKDELLSAMKGHVLAEAQIMGTFDR